MERITKEQRIARVCHEVNRAYCEALGDHSQVPWEAAPEAMKASCIKGVRLHLAHPSAGPEVSHESWLLEKKLSGWVYGPEKNPDSQPPTHPNIVPFAELDSAQQAKDFIFRAIVRALAQ